MDELMYDPELAKKLPRKTVDEKYQEQYENLLYGIKSCDEYSQRELIDLLDWIKRCKGVTDRQVMTLQANSEHLTKIRNQIDEYLKHPPKKKIPDTDSIAEAQKEESQEIDNKSEELQKSAKELQKELEEMFDKLFGSDSDDAAS